jgi:hypothetical protein
MKNEYEMVIAGSMMRAAMRAGKRAGTAYFLAYEDDGGERLFAATFSDGAGQAFENIAFSKEEYGVVGSVLSTWESKSQGSLPWIDLVVVGMMSPRGQNGIEVASWTVPRSLLNDPSKAEVRRLAHAEPMEKQMERIAEAASIKRGRRR